MSVISALNGRLPVTMLTVADTGANGPQSLRVDAAASWARMLAAGMPRGCLRSGYRTLASQAAQDPSLALPAGRSQHGEGIAADVDEPARSWIARYGLSYGWRIGYVPGEPWHAQYDRPDRHQSAPPAPSAPAPTIPEDDMLPYIILLFNRYFGADPTPEQAAAQYAVLVGKSLTDAHAAFRGALATPQAVRVCYRTLLGRDPASSDITARAGKQTLDRMWTDVAASPEAQAWAKR